LRIRRLLRQPSILSDLRHGGLARAEFCRLREISLHPLPKRLYQSKPPEPDSGDDRTSAKAHNHFLVITILPDLIPSIAASQPHPELVESFDSLAALASGSPALDRLSGHLFAFANKRRDRIKILDWGRNGLAVWAKRFLNAEPPVSRSPRPVASR
jgi:hypothetical protein